MKKIFIILIFLSHAGISQNFSWCEPILLTDTWSDNKNAHYLYSIEYPFEAEYLVWEKSWDISATGIYFKKIHPPGATSEVLLKANTHYKNPKMLDIRPITPPSYDTSFFLFYEHHHDNDIDLYYKEFRNNISFGPPIPFLVSDAVDHNISVSNHPENSSLNIVWQSDSSIKSTRFFFADGHIQHTDIITIDSGSCFNPSLSQVYETYVAYQKMVSNESKIFKTEKVANQWSEPVLLDVPGKNIAPSSSGHGILFFEMPYIFWQNIQDETWEIFYHQFSDDDTILCQLDFRNGFNKYSPSSVAQGFGVDYDPFCDYLNVASLVLDSVGSTEIYANDNYEWPDHFVNISNNDVPDRNPVIYAGPPISPYGKFLVFWESFANGRWGIYYSYVYMLLYGSIEDNEHIKLTGLKSSPNPANTKATIEFYAFNSGNCSLKISDTKGKIIRQWQWFIRGSGKQTVFWNLKKQNNQKIPPGLYICTLTIGEESESIKLIVH